MQLRKGYWDFGNVLSETWLTTYTEPYLYCDSPVPLRPL